MFTRREEQEIERNKTIFSLLREAYKKPDLDWVDDLVHYLFTADPIKMSYIQEKWNVVLYLEPLDDFTVVDDAAYDEVTNTIHLFLNEQADQLNPDEVAVEVKRYIFHELYHYQQGNSGKPSQEQRKERFKAFKNEKLTPSQRKMLHQEVDAHAKDYARILEEKGFNVQEAIKSISIMDHPDWFSKTELAEINLYRSHRAIWRRLLSEMFRYYEEEK